ncbi:PBSX phage terminase small subunit [Paenibacillus macerans]|uniref:terminase small subunit n=1 Tax=Paenibacillus macerans TaxID=44252 RepID=UPI001B038549|nr:terminase small subunit [Paenibacillus macerans]GIP10411.1 PBSX phage terminase small subunit [Paenibacillus macerans]
MPRERDPNRNRAKEIWIEYDGNITNRQIAELLGVDEKKIAVWKQRDKWNVVQQTDSSEKSVVQQKSKEKKRPKSKSPPKVEIPVIENDELTDKQRLFISYYLKYWNATKAYQKAYGCDYNTARVEGSRTLAKPNIKEEVIRARDEIFTESFLSAQAIIQKYMDIAFADITDFVEFGTKEESYMNEDGTPMLDAETGEPVTYKRNYVVFNSSSEVDGTIISEVVQGKNGVSVKLADRMKALEKLEKYVGFMTEEEQLKIKKLKGEIALIEQKANTDDDKPIEIVIKRKGDSS